MVDDVEVLEYLGNSDHNIIVCSLICNVGLSKYEEPVRTYHKADHDSMIEWLKCIDWNVESRELEVDKMWQKFCTIIDQVIKLFVPLGHAKNRKIPSWMSKAAKSAVKFESRMWTGYR